MSQHFRFPLVLRKQLLSLVAPSWQPWAAEMGLLSPAEALISSAVFLGGEVTHF